MDLAFWSALGLTIAGWYSTGLAGAQLLQTQIAEKAGTRNDVSFERRRLFLYMAIAAGGSIFGVSWLYLQ